MISFGRLTDKQVNSICQRSKKVGAQQKKSSDQFGDIYASAWNVCANATSCLICAPNDIRHLGDPWQDCVADRRHPENVK